MCAAFYAVRRGRKTGVFRTWDECRTQVDRFSGAEHKKFSTMEDALRFISAAAPAEQPAPLPAAQPPLHPQVARPVPMGSTVTQCQSTGGQLSLPSHTGSGYGGDGGGPFYAVRRGRKTGVFQTWDECKTQVQGFWGAQYRKFGTLQAALQFLTAVPPPGIRPVIMARRRPPIIAARPLPTCSMTRGRRRHIRGVFWGPNDPRNVSEPLLGLQTNNRAEIVACQRAIEQAHKDGIEKLELRTDSKYVIKSVTLWIQTWRKNGWKTVSGTKVKNVEDLRRLHELTQMVNVRFKYVKGHFNSYGNNEADRLARQGSLKERHRS